MIKKIIEYLLGGRVKPIWQWAEEAGYDTLKTIYWLPRDHSPSDEVTKEEFNKLINHA